MIGFKDPWLCVLPSAEFLCHSAFHHVTLQLLINGEFVNAESGKTFPVIDPRTGEEIHRIAEADKADVDK